MPGSHAGHRPRARLIETKVKDAVEDDAYRVRLASLQDEGIPGGTRSLSTVANDPVQIVGGQAVEKFQRIKHE